MTQVAHTVTLWQAWYRDKAEKDVSGRPLRLKLLYASSQEEARQQTQGWLVQKGLLAQDLERLDPSPYGLRFQAS